MANQIHGFTIDYGKFYTNIVYSDNTPFDFRFSYVERLPIQPKRT